MNYRTTYSNEEPKSRKKNESDSQVPTPNASKRSSFSSPNSISKQLSERDSSKIQIAKCENDAEEEESEDDSPEM